MSRRKATQSQQNLPPEQQLTEEHFERFKQLNKESPLAQTLMAELDKQREAGNITLEQAIAIFKAFQEVHFQQSQLLQQQTNRIEGQMTANLDLFRFFDDRADLELSDVEVTYTKPNGIQRKRYTEHAFVQALDLERGEKKDEFEPDFAALEKLNERRRK